MAVKSLFSCRIVDISSYNATPVKDLDVCYSEFRSSAVAKVPVVRIFGSTPTGQKTCLHVHGVFPYIFVPSPVTNPSPSYLQQLASSIDQALQLSLGGNGLKSDQHHVFKISVVKGTPMYGYHEVKDLFLKIYIYNPAMTKKLSELLVAGVVMGTVLQPHEAHIPFVLQMMIDYNLYGMNFIHLSSIKFRSARGQSQKS
jgi:DNA polymerase zeta